LLGGVTLVEEEVSESGVSLLEGLGEGVGLGGLGAGAAVGVERVADDQDFDLVLADEAGDGLEVGAEVGFGGRTVEGEERLRGEAEGVGDGEADAAIADVEREDAGWSLHKRECRG